MEKDKFATAIGALFVTFGVELSPEVVRGYWIGLSDLSESELGHAVNAAIRTSRFLPKPAELRELAGRLVDHDARAIAAWQDVLTAVVSFGPYRHIDFGDKTINAVIRNLGGWPNFIGRLFSAEEEKWARLDFVKTYRSLANVQISKDAAQPLEGLATGEVVNGKLSLPVPITIGTSPTTAAPTLPLASVSRNDTQ